MAKNKSIKWYVALTLLSISAVGLTFLFRSKGEKLSPKNGSVAEAIYGLGTVIAPNTFRAKLAVNLGIKQIFVREGDKVKKGDPLIRFDEGKVMTAPFAGTITDVPFREGELVFPQVPILTLTNLESLYLEVSLEQQSVLRIQRGQKAIASFESLRSEKFEGTVDAIYPRDNQFIVKINLPKLAKGVLPGMTADVSIETGRKDNALLIPLRTITGGKVVRYRNGKKEIVTVQLGVIDLEWGEVLSNNIETSDELLARKK